MNEYDEQIEKLSEHPEQIICDWETGDGLFKFIGDAMELNSGCLTMIRKNPKQFKAIINEQIDDELTSEIASDERIPKFASNITVNNLPVFKEWQERIDKLQNA